MNADGGSEEIDLIWNSSASIRGSNVSAFPWHSLAVQFSTNNLATSLQKLAAPFATMRFAPTCASGRRSFFDNSFPAAQAA
jgi:hypothetical protein